MAMNLKAAEAENRETRLGSVSGYLGTLRGLTEKGCSGCLKKTGRCLSTASYCSHMCALDELSVIGNCVVVDHGPVGCSSGMMRWNIGFRAASILRGLSSKDIQIISTNLDENDTVFGALDKLRETVRQAYETRRPDVIFVTSSCTASIIGEDFQSVVDELNDELPIPVGFAGCDGARSRIWASGFDCEQHAVVKTLVKPPQRKRNTVNVVDFFPDCEARMTVLLGQLGLRPLYLNSYTRVDVFAHTSESVATIGVCNVLSSYFGGALEQAYGVPYLHTHFPNGIENYENWYRDIARLVGKEEEAEKFLAGEREKYLPEFEKYRKILGGKKVLILMGSGFAFELVKVYRELGMDVVQTTSFHYDPNVDGTGDTAVRSIEDGEADVPVSISDAQHYETIKLIRKYKPDVVVTRVHGAPVFSLKLGVPVVTVTGIDSFGYQGTLVAARLIAEELENPNFAKKLARHADFHMTDWYEKQDTDSFLIKDGEDKW